MWNNQISLYTVNYNIRLENEHDILLCLLDPFWTVNDHIMISLRTWSRLIFWCVCKCIWNYVYLLDSNK